MSDVNSSDLLTVIKDKSENGSANVDIDIRLLAESLDITLPTLISVLTELEQRDEIILEITTIDDGAGELQYEGTVRLMDRPPDEIKQG